MDTDSMAHYMKPMYCKCKQSRHKPTVTGTKVMFTPATTNEMDSLKYRCIFRAEYGQGTQSGCAGLMEEGLGDGC